MRVAIVGAGINGLYLSWKLSEMGHDVTVFEKKEKIGKNACSGLFSERILDFIPESQKLIQNQIERALIHFPKRTLKIKFLGRFFVMNHYELDNLVANLALRNGAKIFFNHNVTRKELVTLGGFDRIIGCDGANSIIRKNLGLSEPTYRLAIQGFIPKGDYSSLVETWPVQQGFIWKIPRGKETEYGIISNPEGAKLLLEDFLKKNNLKLGKLEAGMVPQGLTIPTHPSITRAQRRVEMNECSSTTLCGDAAGLAKPWSGGGVIWGLLAAEILLKNFPDFLKYQKEVKRFFLPKIIFSKITAKIVYFLGFNFPWVLPQNIKIEGDFLI